MHILRSLLPTKPNPGDKNSGKALKINENTDKNEQFGIHINEIPAKSSKPPVPRKRCQNTEDFRERSPSPSRTLHGSGTECLPKDDLYAATRIDSVLNGSSNELSALTTGKQTVNYTADQQQPSMENIDRQISNRVKAVLGTTNYCLADEDNCAADDEMSQHEEEEDSLSRKKAKTNWETFKGGSVLDR